MVLVIAPILCSLIQSSFANVEVVVPDTYHKEFPPLPSTQPDQRLIVHFSLEFIKILKINEVESEMQISLFYRVLWNDTRMPPFPAGVEPPLYEDPSVQEKLWRPDIVTENVRIAERNGLLKPTIYQGMFPVSTQFYSTYMAIGIGCTFEYENYPIDVQACSLTVGTMGLTTREIDLHWHPAFGFKMNRRSFLKFLDLFWIQVCEEMSEPVRVSAFGEHPQKTLIIILQRNFRSQIVQVFMPSMFFIMIAWLSVLVPPTMLRTRLLLNSTNLLTIISMFLSICKTESTRVPKVSYVTALNLWMFVCVTFCFSSVMLVIIDIRLVVILTDPGRKIKTVLDIFLPRLTSFATEAEAEEEPDDFTDASDVTPEDSTMRIDDPKLQARVARRRLEWMSRTSAFERVYLVAYPVLFLVFVAAFFTFFLVAREAKLARLSLATGGEGAKYPGCWCGPEDSGHGCMREDDYP